MNETANREDFDYSYVDATARIALYDDMKSAPRITEIPPDTTNDFIEKLTTSIYEQSKLVGGKVPYTLIREVSENFIHAQFKEIVVSILDEGNTIRFADQGPGIKEKEKAQQPGFSSAVEPMKKYIRGVGSGFPIVKDYLDDREGSIEIEDNLVSGAVITISLEQKKGTQSAQSKGGSQIATPSDASSKLKAGAEEGIPFYLPPTRPAAIPLPLSEREKAFIGVLAHEGDLGITEMSAITESAASTTFNTFKRLEEMGIVQKVGKKRALTEFGLTIATQL